MFAALDDAGQVRFISDVPSGAACGCRCPSCGSPLIARKGQVKVHHFAHEASQERPECLAGAKNLLRRVAIDYLRSTEPLPLPRYETVVSRVMRTGLAREQVGWDVHAKAVEWLVEPAQDAPIARVSLDTEIDALLYLQISEDLPRANKLESGHAVLAFSVGVPRYEVLCSLATVVSHLRNSGRFQWISHPDVYGLVRDAADRLRARFDREEDEADQRARVLHERFVRDHPPAPAPLRPQPVPPVAPAKAVPAWAAGKKQPSSYFGVRLHDGSVWVSFPLQAGGHGLKMLNATGPWHERVPHHVGRYQPEQDLVVCPNPPILSSPAATRISSDLEEVLQLCGR